MSKIEEQDVAQALVLQIRDAVQRNRGARISPEFRAVLNAFEELDATLSTGGNYPFDWE